jgi:hypothetical protein
LENSPPPPQKKIKTKINQKTRGINRFSSLFFREKSEKYLNLGIILAYVPPKPVLLCTNVKKYKL